VCTSGARVCDATAGAPTAERCNGLDDDCDGQVDEASAGLCAENGQSCGAGVCSCPAGQVVCGGACVTLGGDCGTGLQGLCAAGTLRCDAANTGTQCVQKLMPSRELCDNLDNDCNGVVDDGNPEGGVDCDTDQRGICRDGVRTCRGVQLECVRRNEPRAETCNGEDDNCNGFADDGVLAFCFPDADGDGYPDNRNGGIPKCGIPGPTPGTLDCPPGFISFDTPLEVDCNPQDRNLFRLETTRADTDGDWHCAGPVVTECVGAALPTGRRHVTECGADDCNDSSFSTYQWANLRNDVDGDGRCAGSAAPVCIGATVPAGRRLASECGGEDCRDTNANVAQTCFVADGYETESHSQTCPNPRQQFGLSVVRNCAPGMRATNPRAVTGSGSGACTAVSEQIIEQWCIFLEGTDCKIVADCVAW
jgi:hypothetical protein